MFKSLYIFVHVFLLVSAIVQQIHATKFIVTNNVPNSPGGKLFDTQIGASFTLFDMRIIKDFILKTFEQSPSEAKDVPVLNVYISDFKGYAYAQGPIINISAPALNQFYFPRNRSRFFFSSVMYHEMTHVYQWNANFAVPFGLLEGIADYVMVKSNMYEKEKYTKPGAGKKWDEGYGVTARFLEYCDSLRSGFTAALNKKMRYKYSDNYFVELLGKNLDQLWRDYKAKYGNLLEDNSSSSRFAGLM